ncbi:hypothetical protein [Pedobacter gandavensis]|uniref:hypothetical protein n=1 Tax=Pedobacter gandavensis TaxID=2679963 RepID=UPI00292D65F8|nr:hypothetical protein [Pedobacter gandavensis]
MKKTPIIAWFSFLTGFIISAYFVWKTFRKTVVIELSSNTIKHKDYCYGWGRLQSYEIRYLHSNSYVGTYLFLNSKNATIPLKICLDVLEDQESFKHQMAIYAKANHIELEKYT